MSNHLNLPPIYADKTIASQEFRSEFDSRIWAAPVSLLPIEVPRIGGHKFKEGPQAELDSRHFSAGRCRLAESSTGQVSVLFETIPQRIPLALKSDVRCGPKHLYSLRTEELSRTPPDGLGLAIWAD